MKPDGMTRAFCIVILMGVGVAVTMYGLFELNHTLMTIIGLGVSALSFFEMLNYLNQDIAENKCDNCTYKYPIFKGYMGGDSHGERGTPPRNMGD